MIPNVRRKANTTSRASAPMQRAVAVGLVVGETACSAPSAREASPLQPAPGYVHHRRAHAHHSLHQQQGAPCSRS